MAPIVTSRSDLLSLLSEACELEHGLACSYLYAAFTLKTDPGDGLAWRETQLTRKWAAQIYFVASQEMLHLAQVWNLLASVGGTPYYFRPNFPQEGSYYPLGERLVLEPFGATTLQRFLVYERPMLLSGEWPLFIATPKVGAHPRFAYATIGELYALIHDCFDQIPPESLFVGDAGQQAGESLVDFPDIVPVFDADSARRAIRMITHQGEGLPEDRIDCHFGMFHEIARELSEAETGTKGGFRPARDTIENPAARRRGDYAAPDANILEDPTASELADIFDGLYVSMLRMLAFAFANSQASAAVRSDLARAAIVMMPIVIKPLGEALTMLPAGQSYGTKRAGPAFGMSRHVQLPQHDRAARVVVAERLAELGARLADSARAIARMPADLPEARALPLVEAACTSLARIVTSVTVC